MVRFLDLLCGGDWLTLARMRLWAMAVLVATFIPLGVIAMLVMFWLVMRRARRDLDTAGVPAPAR